tara:strand:+ start:1914 stop:2108 length:195 start_codon:yes stop_codon:yes gene_type:complete
MEDVLKFLDECERDDLVAILLDYMDKDYTPPEKSIEPVEEYFEQDSDKEEIEVGITKDGFHYLK